ISGDNSFTTFLFVEKLTSISQLKESGFRRISALRMISKPVFWIFPAFTFLELYPLNGSMGIFNNWRVALERYQDTSRPMRLSKKRASKPASYDLISSLLTEGSYNTFCLEAVVFPLGSLPIL